VLSLLLLLLACGPDDTPTGSPELDTGTAAQECAPGGPRPGWLVSRFTITPVSDGISDGFDLDDGAEGCGVDDFVAPDGTDGIDNAFGTLLPALALTEAAAIEPLINASIKGGNLLVTFELDDLDDPWSDACVTLNVGRGDGVPMLGTDGEVLWGQTLDRAGPADFSADASVVDGVTETDLQLTLPVEIFGLQLDFELNGGAIRLEQQDDGTVTGVLAGGIDVAYILQVAREENVDPDLAGVLEVLLAGAADLAPDADGTCTQVSMALSFETIPVFFFE
jgi:hypothetical protein